MNSFDSCIHGFFTVFIILFAGVAQASTTYNVQIGNILDSSGSNVALGTVGILVVDTQNNGFAGSSPSTYTDLIGLALSSGQSVGDDIIVGVYQASDLGGVIGFNDSTVVNYTGNITDADKLALYWFPGVTTVGATLGAGQSSMGFFRSDTVSIDSGGSFAFILPSDTGALGSLAYFDSTVVPSSGISSSQLQAQSISAVPEPSRILFLALGGMGLLMRRRRD